MVSRLRGPRRQKVPESMVRFLAVVAVKFYSAEQAQVVSSQFTAGRKKGQRNFSPVLRGERLSDLSATT